MKAEETESGRMENLDRILASEEELVPSSGFAASVMERVREENAIPEPIPFPWKRALPAMLIVAVGLVLCLVELLRMAMAAPVSSNGTTAHFTAFQAQSVKTVGWAVAALGVSLLSWLLARRMVGRDGAV